jgi:hypothetical protein
MFGKDSAAWSVLEAKKRIRAMPLKIRGDLTVNLNTAKVK